MDDAPYDDDSTPTPGTSKAATLLALHAGPGFVLPNAWDPGSARILAGHGFPAIGTTSAGVAWASGVPDGESMSRDQMLMAIAAVVASVDVPVTADLEAGYGTTAELVGTTINAAVRVGVVGANLEDAGPHGLFDVAHAVDRLTAARSAAPRGTFVLNARVDTYFKRASAEPFAETIERAHRYVEAGADCIFVPGVADAETIHRLAEEIPAPLNIVAGLANAIDAPTLFSLGVKRVSLGGSLARAALTALDRAAQELRSSGTLGFLEGSLTYADLQHRFSS